MCASLYVKEIACCSVLCTSTAGIANTVPDLIFIAELESISVSQVTTVSKGLKLFHSAGRNKDEKHSASCRTDHFLPPKLQVLSQSNQYPKQQIKPLLQPCTAVPKIVLC